MKKIENSVLLVWLCMFILCEIACKRNDGYNYPVSTDKTKPAIVTNIKVDDYNGGSFITYDLPNSPNILYVLAKYQIRNGVSRETKSSYYSDTINVEGFAKAQEYTVTLYTINRANVSSDPVTVKVNPKTPVYELVAQGLSLSPDFGGVNVKTLNPLKKEIGVILTVPNSLTNKRDIIDQHYAKLDTIDYSLRGYNTDPREFGAYVTDNFGNISDTIKKTISPLYEELLNKSQFAQYVLASDVPIGFGWVLPNLWDGKTDGSSNGWHADHGFPAPWVCTFGVGQSYRLSRFVIWERPDSYAYNHGNPEIFSMWGSNVTQPKDSKLPLSAPIGTVVGDWINLGNFRYPNPPSGLPANRRNEADAAFVKAGVNFNFALANPSVRFIRFAVSQTWSFDDAPHVMELSFYGQPQ